MSARPRLRLGRRAAIWLLGTLVLLLAVANLLILALGPGIVPGRTDAEKAADRYAAVRAAAADAVNAFLAVDYRNQDAKVQAVLDRSTGTFAQNYAATRSSLVAAAKSAKATSEASIRQVGVGDLNGSKAVVFVAADAIVGNTQTAAIKATPDCPHAGKACRYYRLKLTMTQVGGDWKISGLDFVS